MAAELGGDLFKGSSQLLGVSGKDREAAGFAGQFLQHTRPDESAATGLVEMGVGHPDGVEDNLAAVGGFEYTFFQVFESEADLGLLAEYLYDGRDEDKAPPTSADNDVFVGARLALNDVQDTSALLGAVVDVEDRSTALFVEAARRLGDSWKLELESRRFLGVSDSNPLNAFEDDDFVVLRLSYFF